MNNQFFNNIQQVKQMMRASQNPMQILQQMAQQNPAINQVLQMCEGKTPEQQKQVFYSLANQMGINPEEFLSFFR